MKKKEINKNLKDFEVIACVQGGKHKYIYDRINNRFFAYCSRKNSCIN